MLSFSGSPPLPSGTILSSEKGIILARSIDSHLSGALDCRIGGSGGMALCRGTSAHISSKVRFVGRIPPLIPQGLNTPFPWNRYALAGYLDIIAVECAPAVIPRERGGFRQIATKFHANTVTISGKTGKLGRGNYRSPTRAGNKTRNPASGDK
jgi:hypothetical protein